MHWNWISRIELPNKGLTATYVLVDVASDGWPVYACVHVQVSQ